MREISKRTFYKAYCRKGDGSDGFKYYKRLWNMFKAGKRWDNLRLIQHWNCEIVGK